MIVPPENQGNIGLDVGDQLCDGPPGSDLDVEAVRPKAKVAQLGAIFLGDGLRSLDQVPLAPLDRLPVRIVADERTNHDAVMFPDGLEHDPWDAEDAVVV